MSAREAQVRAARLMRAAAVTVSWLGMCAAPVATQPPAAAAIDSLFAEWDNLSSPGCVLRVTHHGDAVYEHAYGMADLETGTPLTANKVFYLASVSKQFTAATAVLLALDGRLSLDDDVRRYVPELPDYGHTITIRHLLTHTSGLRDYLTLMELAGMSLEEAWTPDQILELVARQRELNFPPGERYLYSNTGYFLIPIIVERITGQSVRDFADEQIFEPLGMTRTQFHDDHRRAVQDRALSYAPTDSGTYRRSFLEKFDQVGSGGVLSTVGDLAIWDRNFYTGAVGGQEFLRQLQTRGVLANGDTIDYALGLSLSDYNGARTVSHGGSMMGFRTHLLRFPDDRFSIVCLCNLASIDPGAIAYDVADILLADRFDETLSVYGGHYRSSELHTDFRIRVERGTLVMEPRHRPEAKLRSLGADRFEVRTGLTLEFERDDTGDITAARLHAGRANGIAFVKQ